MKITTGEQSDVPKTHKIETGGLGNAATPTAHPKENKFDFFV